MSPNVTGDWPGASYEERQWDPALDVRDSFGPHRASPGPYRATVPPLIAQAEVSLSSAVQAIAIDATAELVRFDAEFGRRDPALPSLLLHAEAAASSAIERVTSPAISVILAELDDVRDPSASQIISHIRALDFALGYVGPLSQDFVVQIQRTLMATTRPERRGRWRDQQVWIGGGALGPQRASFVPPHQSRVAELMADLLQFATRTDIPSLAQVAIAHAQYETIHPFLEVNGRTGRVFMQSMLRRTDITRSLVVPVSAGLLQDTAAYFDALTKYRAGRVDALVEAFSTAVFTAVANARELVDDLVAIREAREARATSRQGSGARRLMPVLETRPVMTSRIAVEHLGVTAPNAQLAIDRLTEDGILVQHGESRRNRVWVAPDVLEVLDAFAERARRRR